MLLMRGVGWEPASSCDSSGKANGSSDSSTEGTPDEEDAPGFPAAGKGRLCPDCGWRAVHAGGKGMSPGGGFPLGAGGFSWLLGGVTDMGAIDDTAVMTGAGWTASGSGGASSLRGPRFPWVIPLVNSFRASASRVVIKCREIAERRRALSNACRIWGSGASWLSSRIMAWANCPTSIITCSIHWAELSRDLTVPFSSLEISWKNRSEI